MLKVLVLWPMISTGTERQVYRQARYVTGHILGVDGGFLAAGVMHRDT